MLGALLMGAAALPATTQAADPPEGAAISPNLEYVTRMPEANGITEGKFDEVRGKDVLVITGRFGFKTYDVSEPAKPKLLDEFIPNDLAAGGYWQNEDMELDTKRKLIIGALDPRHTDSPLGACPAGGSTANPACRSGFYVISYANPSDLKQVGNFVPLPSGHTSSCIQDCKYIWTGGPARRSDQLNLGPILSPTAPAPYTFNRLVGDGRPIWVTDLTNPAKPDVSDQPVDIWRNDGYTDYSHDVDEDDEGIAWVSGRGGIRGYATRGRFRDPATDRRREATPWSPILVAGGGVAGVSTPGPEGRFMHNSMRPLNGLVHARGVRDGNILVGTEEQFNGACADDGRLVFSDITASLGGEPSQNSTAEHPFRMRAIATWHPALDTPETTAPNTDCSAHYFDIQGATLTQAWYSQGTRVLDISNAARPRQIAFFRVQADGSADNPSSVVWDTTFHRGLLWVFDNSRGVEVLRLRGSTSRPGRLRSVVAPDALPDGFVARPVRDFATSYVCPLFRAPAAAVAAGVVTGT